METWDLLRNIWFILIGVLFVGYSILDGFDLGIGSLFPFLTRRKGDKETLYKVIAPVWDGNEVWLLTGGGALFAAFPHAYATVFSGFYLALMLALFALIFRAVSLEFRAHDLKRQRLWDGAFFVGSLLPSLLFGVALGNVIQGIPLYTNMDYAGNFFTLLRPFPLVIGFFGLTAILLQGSSYATMKTEGKIQEKSIKIAQKLWVAYGVFMVLSFVFSIIYIPGASKKVLAWVFTGIIVVCLILMKFALKKKKDGLAFLLSSLSFCGLWGIAGAIHFPNLVKASNDSALSLTIYNSSSSELTLRVILIIALVGMPIVIAYTTYLYKVFKGKTREEEKAY
ncbi:MAG: cytochrome d ubiquinol oxidase subunit II [Candidatus Aminicenantes bacterium]|nr:cytochrome d ubiquinol oxidase subunit II [Candidatus Aminicenantes bacterium]MDH5384530.1 cytochrome d ubiquinol oxidase subunit II [Candidatus Aminicenantes bacterium]MDH5744511.1 cytochrome d ubiquinol oxidase subunit II [Candidatus Aminicenantes bacterium]